jgi:hypothetical protein
MVTESGRFLNSEKIFTGNGNMWISKKILIILNKIKCNLYLNLRWERLKIPSSHLRLGLPSRLFPSGFPNKTSYIFLPSPMRAKCIVHFLLLDLICLIIFWVDYKLWSSPLCNFLHSPHLSHLGPNIPFSTFSQTSSVYAVPWMWDQVSYTYKNNWPNYGFVYFNLYVPSQQAGKQKTLNRMVASIPWIQSALDLFAHAILIC